VGRDHHGPRVCRRRLLFNANAFGAQFREYGFVVYQLAQDGQRFLFCGFQRQRDGVSHSKTHAQMFRPNYFHASSISTVQTALRRRNGSFVQQKNPGGESGSRHPQQPSMATPGRLIIG